MMLKLYIQKLGWGHNQVTSSSHMQYLGWDVIELAATMHDNNSKYLIDVYVNIFISLAVAAL